MLTMTLVPAVEYGDKLALLTACIDKTAPAIANGIVRRVLEEEQVVPLDLHHEIVFYCESLPSTDPQVDDNNNNSRIYNNNTSSSSIRGVVERFLPPPRQLQQQPQ